MAKNLFFCMLLFVAISQCSAQGIKTEAVIVLNDLTIRHGILKNRDWETSPEKIQFKIEEDDRFVTYTPSQIKSFSIGDIKYVSKYLLTDQTPIATNNLKRELIFDTASKWVFVKQLISGKKPLYEYINANGVPNYFIEMTKDSIHLLIYKRYIDDQSKVEIVEKYKNQLTFYFSDCMEMLEDIKSISYSESSLLTIFAKYHQCKGQSTSQVKKEKLKYTFDISGGFTYSKIKFGGSPELLFSGGQFKSFSSYAFLISAGLPIVKKFQRRNIVAELGIKNNNIVGADSMQGGIGSSYLANINLKYSYIKGNLLYRHYFILLNNISAFADLGFSVGRAFRKKGEVRNVTNGLIYTNYNNLNASDANFTIGAGVLMHKILAMIRYEQGNLLTINSAISSNIKTIYIMAGLRIF
jgi:hypothetical protein